MIHRVVLTGCVAILTIVLVFACGKKEQADVREQQVATLKAPLEGDEVLLQKASEQAIARFGAELQTSLKHALDEGGPASAVSVCNVIAPKIAMEHAREGWFIERVTDRPRNINNSADSIQLQILERFADTTGAPSFVARWDDPEKKEKFYYYKPVRLSEMCLSCHGAESDLAEGVSEMLRENYPRDRAVGYKVGDLRGMIAVEVMWPEGRAYAEQLASPSK